MLSGKVAATLGGFWNYEGDPAPAARRNPLVIPVDQAGVPTYDELVLVVREDEAHTRGQDMRGFMQALTRGEQEVRADPAAAAPVVVTANPRLDSQLQLAVDPAHAARGAAGRPVQALRLAGARAVVGFARWMVSHGLVGSCPRWAAAALHQRVPARPGGVIPGAAASRDR